MSGVIWGDKANVTQVLPTHFVENEGDYQRQNPNTRDGKLLTRGER